MKRLMQGLTVLCLWVFSGCGTGLEAENSPGGGATQGVIVPGQGLSELKLGDPYSRATQLYGPGLHSYMSLNGSYSHRIDYFALGLALRFNNTEASIKDDSKIAAIEISGPSNRKTEKGIGVGSKLDEVKGVYGTPKTSSTFFGDVYENGLVFEYEDGVVTRIVIR